MNVSYFGDENELSKFTGVKIGAMLIPVFLLLVFLGNADMGLAAVIVLGVLVVAIKLHWKFRKHLWFWTIILIVLALHVPIFRTVRWPQGSTPTLAYTMPFATIDFLLISGALWLAEKLFSNEYLTISRLHLNEPIYSKSKVRRHRRQRNRLSFYIVISYTFILAFMLAWWWLTGISARHSLPFWTLLVASIAAWGVMVYSLLRDYRKQH